MELKLSEIDSIKDDNAELLKNINYIEKTLTEYREQYKNNIEKIQSYANMILINILYMEKDLLIVVNYVEYINKLIFSCSF